jgi:hypothetical protein
MTETEVQKTEEPTTVLTAAIDSVTFRVRLSGAATPCPAAAADDNRMVRPDQLLITARNHQWEVVGMGIPVTKRGEDYAKGNRVPFDSKVARLMADPWIEEILSQTEMRGFELPAAPVPLLTPTESDKIGVLGSMFGDDVSAWPEEVRAKAKADGLLRFEEEPIDAESTTG